MAEYSPAKNPQVITPVVVNSFAGMRGTSTEVITRYNTDGDNVSDQYANQVIDFDCDVAGALHIRPGCKKFGNSFLDDVIGLFMINLGGITQYGTIDGLGDVDLIDIPDAGFPDPFYLDPDTETFSKDTMPSDWPSGWAKPTDPVDDVPIEDASCEDGHTHAMSPSTLSFTMDYQQATAPDAQYCYTSVYGHWAPDQVGVVTSAATGTTTADFVNESLGAVWAWDVGSCYSYAVQQIKVAPNGKDSDGSWLAAGTYTGQVNDVFTDGDAVTCAVTLVVRPPYTGSLTVNLTYGGSNKGNVNISYSNDGTYSGWTSGTWAIQIGPIYPDISPLAQNMTNFKLLKTIATGIWSTSDTITTYYPDWYQEPDPPPDPVSVTTAGSTSAITWDNTTGKPTGTVTIGSAVFTIS